MSKPPPRETRFASNRRWKRDKKEAARQLSAESAAIRRDHCAAYVSADRAHHEASFKRVIRQAVARDGLPATRERLALHVSLHL